MNSAIAFPLNNKGFSPWELTLALLVIFLLMVSGLNVYFGVLQASKEAALKSSMGSLRSSINVIYKAKFQGKLPDGVTPGQRLEDLVETPLPPVDLGEMRRNDDPPITNKVFIDPDKDNKPIRIPLNDQGGYVYKPSTGEVRLNVDPAFRDSEGKPFSEY